MSNILVAVVLNMVASLILVGGILTSINCGWKVALSKLVLTLCAGAVTFLLTPYLSNEIWMVEGIPTLASQLCISQVTVNSCLFFVVFLLLFGLNSIVCSIIKHTLIKAMKKSTSENRARIKRAKSINPKAERAARRTIWRELKTEYKSTNKWWKKVLSLFIGMITYTLLGFVVLLPINYIAKDLNSVNNNEFEYLTIGYEYTLNGVIGEEVCDFIISADIQDYTPEVEEQPEDEPVVEEA